MAKRSVNVPNPSVVPSAGPDTPAPEKRLCITVVGDLLADWIFLSGQPAPSRVPNHKPWSRDSLARLFCIPGGAWFTGHMLYGALTVPAEFERTHTVAVKATTPKYPICVNLTGEPAFGDEQQIKIKVCKMQGFSIYGNDELVGALDEDIEIVIERTQTFSPLQINMQASELQFSFEGEDTLTPGFFEVSQIGRCYNLENVKLASIAKSYKLCFFDIRIGRVTLLGKGGEIPLHSISIRSAASAPQSTFDVECECALKKASMRVNYGELTASTVVVDHGKISPIRSTKDKVQLRHIQRPRFDMLFYAFPDACLTHPNPARMLVHLSQIGKFDRYAGQKSKLQVFRRSRRHGTDGPTIGPPEILMAYNHESLKSETIGSNGGEVSVNDILKKSTSKLVVVDDQGLGFADRKDIWDIFKSEDSQSFFIFKATQGQGLNRKSLLEQIDTHSLLERSVFVVSAESLRDGLIKDSKDAGAMLSKTLSWEESIDDLLTIIASSALLCKAIMLVVRFGHEGIAAIHFNTTGGVQRLDFACDPVHIEGEYAPKQFFGSLPGETTVLTCAICSSIVNAFEADPDSWSSDKEAARVAVASAISKAIPHGLRAIRRYFDLGYGIDATTIERFANLQLPTSQVFRTGRVPYLASEGMHKFCSIKLGGEDLKAKWSFLNNFFDKEHSKEIRDSFEIEFPRRDGVIDQALRRGVNALKLGRRIIRSGFENSLARLGSPFPYAKLSNLIAVERDEIVAIRSLRNILSEFIFRTTEEKPISVAVFGPPGSGKSFAVKQIASAVAKNLIVEFTFNLAQFNTFEDVTRLLLEVRDARLRKKIPLVFFDEFDSPRAGVKLGWLKYFLAPMQDGTFQHGDSLLGTGKAIFVFAGGIASSMSIFRDAKYWDKDNLQFFKDAKGPDFESRLRAFMDVKGINPCNQTVISGQPNIALTFPISYEFVIRRAILARYNIEKLASENAAALLDVDGNAEIDDDVINALLMCSEYLHGARSMEAIFDACQLLGEHAITKTSIPPEHILSMFVDPSFSKIVSNQDVDKILDTILAADECDID